MRIETSYLVAAAFVTMLILYLLAPEPEIVIKYPDISKEISDVYVDDQGVCYRYHRVKVDDEKDVKQSSQDVSTTTVELETK